MVSKTAFYVTAKNSANFRWRAFLFRLLLQEPMKSKAPQLHLEYRFYKLLGTHGEYYFHTITF